MPERAASSPRLELYGVTLASDFRFASCLLPSSGVPQLTFQCTAGAPPDSGHGQALYAGARAGRASGATSLHRIGRDHALRIEGLSEYRVGYDRVRCYVLDIGHEDLVELAFLGAVMALWLHLRGVVTLHASAVEYGGRAVAFVGSKGAGKSSLASSCVEAGLPLLTDDLLPVESTASTFLARRGLPQMRLAPPQAMSIRGRASEWPVAQRHTKVRVPVGPRGWGAFCDGPRPLGAVYLLGRQSVLDAGQTRITEVRNRDALGELIANSSGRPYVSALGLQQQRLDTLAAMARRVPIRRVSYPSGSDTLPRTRDAILADAGGLW